MASLGTEMVEVGLGGPVLLLAGRSAAARLASTWKKTFAESGFPYSVQAFGGECSRREIETVKQAAQGLGAGVIVGAGGGKVLDTARAAAADLRLAVATCPTAASSDAPCSALSVVYSEAGAFEEYRFYRKNPDLVLVDTTVIAQAPPRLLVAGMGDALATLFEARTCVAGQVRNMRGGASTRSALALAELCYRTLIEDGCDALAAVERQAVTPALERIVEANTLLSGLGFESSGLAAAHAIHNGLTVAADARAYFHGEKVAFGTLAQLVLEGKPRRTIEEVLAFSHSVGLPTTLSDIGLQANDSDMLKAVAERATAEEETIHNEPFAVSAEMVHDALRAADSIGEQWKLSRRT